jgi:MFS family permease
MLSFLTKAPRSRRTLLFGSAMHIWSDLYFALMVPLLPLMQEDLDLSLIEVGLLRSVFSGATAVLQIPMGLLAESAGEFWLLIWGNVWVSVGLVGMALSAGFAMLLVVSFFAGLGGGAQHPLASSMVSRAYDDRGRSTAVGTVNFAGDIGKMIAPLLAAVIAVQFGWRTTLWVVGLAGIVFMAFSAATRRRLDIGKPAQHREAADSDGDDEDTRVSAFVTLSWIGFLDSATRGSALVFLPFVMTAKDMGTAKISLMLFLLFTGGAAGKFVVGWLGDRYSFISLVWATKGLAAVTLALSLVAPPLALVPLMLALGAGLNGTSSILYATVADFVPARRRARLYGIYYTTNEGGTILAPPLYGLVGELLSLNVAILVMAVATAAILPVSLTLRRHLSASVRP